MKGLINEALGNLVRTKGGSVQDGTASPWLALDRYGRIMTAPGGSGALVAAGGATVTTVTVSSGGADVVLAADTARRGASFFNTSLTETAYINIGANADTND